MKSVARCAAILILTCSLALPGFSQAVGDFGSAGTGNWGTTGANWVVCATAGTWVGATAAGTAPASTNNVWIRAGHTVTVEVSGKTCNNLTIESTGSLVGANTLPTSSLRYVRIYGSTLTNSGNIGGASDCLGLGLFGTGSQVLTITGIGTTYLSRIQPQAAGQSVIFDANVQCDYAGSTGTGSTAIYTNNLDFSFTVNAGKTLTMARYAYISAHSSSGTSAGTVNFAINVYGTITTGNNAHINLNTASGKTGSLTIYSGGTVNLGDSANIRADVSGASYPIAINSSGALNGGNNTAGGILLSQGTTTLGGTVDFKGSATTNRSIGTATVNSGALIRLKDGTFPSGSVTLNSGSTVEYYGTSGLTIPASPSTYSNLTVNNSGGVTLGGGLAVDGILTFTSGLLSTSTYTLTIGSSGSISGAGTGKYVNGMLARTYGTGAQSFTYPVGSSGNYSPVDLSFNNVTGSGTVTASTAAGDHASIGTSGLDASKSVNRTWTLTNSATTFDTYAATLNFVTGDVDGGATPANFLVRKYDSGTWSAPTTASPLSNSIQATGLSSFSDFAVGELLPPASDAPVVNSPIAEGATSVSGTSTEANGTTISVYVDNSLVNTTTVSSNAWTLSGMTALTAGQTVKATALASGKSVSAYSNVVTVQAYTAAPAVDTPIGTGATSVSGTSSEANGTTVYVYIDNTLTDSTTVTSGTWTQSGLTALSAGQTVKAKALAAGKLLSGFSNTVTVATVTAAPVVTSPIGEGSTSVSGTSTEADGTTISVYVDNSLVNTATVSSNAWTLTGMTALNAGQTVKAKALASGKVESGFSNTVTVQAYSAAPTVSVPISTGATAVYGMSSEADGTAIDVYVDNTLTASTTVSSGSWAQTGLTALSAGQTVKAKATAPGKLVSNFSNTVTVTNVLSISTSSPLPNATAGSAYSATFAAAGGTPPYGSWGLVAGSLPSGMSLNPSTGEISGTATGAGVSNFIVRVVDGITDTAFKPFQLTVDPATLDHFAVASISTPQAAGTAFGITVTAQDVYNNTVTGFGGTVNISTTAGTVSPSVSGSFALGVRNENVTVTQSGTGKTVGVDDGSGHTGTSNPFDVNSGTLDHFAIASISTPQAAGTAFGITITAQDIYNNTVTGFGGTVNLSTTAGTVSPSVSGSFALGVRNENVTVTQSGTGKTIGVDDGSGHTATSNPFDVNPGALDHFGIGTIATPQIQGVAFNLVMTAQDLNNNTVPGFTGTVGIALSTGTIAPTTSSAFASGLRTEPVTVSTAGTGLTILIDDGSGHTGTSGIFDVNAPAPYRSAASGDWSSAGSWETFNGSTWVGASVPPSAADGAIEIRSPHTITVSSSVAADQLTVDLGATLAISASVTLTIADGSGTDLDVSGTVNNSGTITLSTGNVVNFNNGSYYNHMVQSAAVPKSATGIVVNWAPNSTCEISGLTSTSGISGMFTTVPAGADWGNIIWNTTGLTTTGNFNFGGNLQSIKGSFTMKSTGSGPALFRFHSSSTNTPVSIAGDFIIQGGTLQFGGGNAANAGTSLTIGGNWNQTGGTFAANMSSATLPIKFTGSGKTFTQSGGTLTNTGLNWFVKSGASLTLNNSITLANSRGDTVESGGTLNLGTNTVSGSTGTTFILQSGGTLGIGSTAGITASAASGNIQTATRSFDAGANYTYNGSSGQVTGDGLPSTVNGLTIANAAGVSLTNPVTVSGTLAFTSGLLTGGGNTVTIANGGTVTGAGAGKYLYGTLARVTPSSGSPTLGFDVGDASNYTPVSLAFHTLSSAGTVTAKSTAGDRVLAGSGLDSMKTVNRTWTLTNTTAAFSTYDATFTFINPGDLDAGVNTNNLLAKKYDGAWTNLSVGNRTSTSTQATGVTSFSDFSLGEAQQFGSLYQSTLGLSFGSVVVGDSLTDSMYVKNTGAGTLNISSIASDASPFTVTPASGTLASGDSAWVFVKFKPSANGAVTGNIVFTHDGGGSPDTVTVSGTGYTPAPVWSVAPASLNFGSVVVGNSLTDSVKVKNTGNATLNVTSISPDNARFTTGSASATIAAGDSAWIRVTYSPLSAVTDNGNIVFTHNAAGSPDTVTVSGTGLILAPVWSINASSISFGGVVVSTPKQDSVTVTNTGNASLSVSSVTSDNSLFTVSPPSGTVGAGNSMKFFITFTPTATGGASGNIIFTHNAAGSPDTVTVSGTGTSGAATITSNGTGGGAWSDTNTWVGHIAPTSIDSAIILGTDSVTTTSTSFCSGLNVHSGGKLALVGRLNVNNVTLDGKIRLLADTLKPTGTMTVGSAGTYDHARDSGRTPTATWSPGSTFALTGIVTGAPSNSRQTFSNVTWNCPAQTASLNLGWHSSTAGVDTTITINGDITVLSTGTGRWQFCAPPVGSAGARSVARVNIAGRISVSGRGVLTAIGSSNNFTDVVITVNGNVSVQDSLSQLSISRGSQGGTGTTTWLLKGDSVTYGRKTVNQNSTDANTAATSKGKFIFCKPGTQYVYVDSANSWTGECNMWFGDSVNATVVDAGNSQFTGSACTQRVRHNSTLILGPSGYVGGGTNTNSIPSNFTIDDGATLVMASVEGIRATGMGSSGAVRVSGNRNYGTAANFTYNGSSPQGTGSGLPATVNNLTISNASGVTLDSTALVTVNGVFTLGGGVLTTSGSNVLGIGQTGSVSRTSGHVAGNLRRYVAAGSAVSRVFDIGDASNYTPVSLTFASVTTPGDLQASTAAGDHAQIGSSGIDPAKDVNRTWSFTNSGVAFTTCDAVFQYAAGDVDAGSDYTTFIAEKYDGSWTPLTVGTRAPTSTEVTGLTGFSDFAIGQPQVVYYTITATAGLHGQIAPTGSVQVVSGTGMSFTFDPDAGYHVDSVFVDGGYIGAPSNYQFTNVTSNRSIHVVFAVNPPATFTLTVNATHGTVAVNPAQALYDSGTVVQLTALPATGYHFVNWTGDLSGSLNPAPVTMNANKTVTAVFAINQYTLTVNVVGFGAVVKNPNQAQYDTATVVQLTATPDIGQHFTGWSGDLTGSTNPAFLTMTGNKTVTATFARDTYTLTVNTTGDGSVTKNPDQAQYDSGASVQLTPVPGAGSHFVSWSGDLTGSANPGSITMVANMTVGATFSVNQYTLDVTIVGSGTVTKNPDQPLYDHGTLVGLKATPTYGWLFSGWSGGAGGTADSVTLTMLDNTSVTATFIPDPVLQQRFRTFTKAQLEMNTEIKPVRRARPGKPVVMPNTANLVDELIRQGHTIMVGKPQQIGPDGRERGYLILRSQTFTAMTFSYRGVTHTSPPHGFDYFVRATTGSIIRGKRTYVHPQTHNNKLLADLIALKINLLASLYGKTPAGLADLVYDNGPGDRFRGLTIGQIADSADFFMSGWRIDPALYTDIDSTVERINRAFAKSLPIDGNDTLSWMNGKKLSFGGIRSLLDVPYLHAGGGAASGQTWVDNSPVDVRPGVFSLSQNYPNPFNPTTVIDFQLAEPALVTLTVYNVLGQEVATLLNRESMEDGLQEVEFSASNMPSGVYFYRLVAENSGDETAGQAIRVYTDVKKMLLVK